MFPKSSFLTKGVLNHRLRLRHRHPLHHIGLGYRNDYLLISVFTCLCHPLLQVWNGLNLTSKSHFTLIQFFLMKKVMATHCVCNENAVGSTPTSPSPTLLLAACVLSPLEIRLVSQTRFLHAIEDNCLRHVYIYKSRTIHPLHRDRLQYQLSFAL